MKSFSIKEAVSYGWEAFNSRPWFFVGITAITFLINSIGNLLDNKDREEATLGVAFIFVVIALLTIVANIIVSIGSQKIFLKTERGEIPKFVELFAHANLFFKVFVGCVLYGLIVLLGLILFIIPGIIFAIKYGFQYILIIDKGLGPVEALKESAKLTRGIKWHLFLLGLILGLLNVLGALAFGVGLLVSVPLTNLAIVYIYRKLLSETSQAGVSSPTI